MKLIWNTESLPESDINVLVRLSGCEEPLAIGYFDGKWRESGSDALFGFRVDGWIDVDDLADYLDAATILSRQEVLVAV